MISNNGHIVSRFSWNTSFDKKDTAGELQNRLSSWSRLIMPSEVAGIFDDLCPPGQTWHIPSLQIDLGKIEYIDLEPELSARLCKQLYEQLTDLILHSYDKKDCIEILDEAASGIRLIRHFLAHGFIPWYHNAPDQAINPLLALYLETNRDEVITMLREIGITHENVRRRIAWQVSEPNIIAIVKGLEPNNHQQVIDFADELARLQQHENIVQGSLSDFKKNLWFWILNYLFAERGTIFNKIAFAKSNVRQMAGHYHVGYNELMGIIEMAVNKVEQRYSRNVEIIAILKDLIAEGKDEEYSMPGITIGIVDFWSALDDQSGGLPHLASEISEAELNDIVMSLAAEDSVRLKEMIVKTAGDERLLSALVRKLNESSFRVLLATMNDGQADVAAESILLIEGVFKEQRIAIDKYFLREAAFKFFLDQRESVFTINKFLSSIADQISERKQIDKMTLLERLLTATTSSSTKTAVNLEIHKGLTSIFISELSSGNEAVTAERFNNILQRLSELHRSGSEKHLFISLKKVLVQYLRSNPRVALSVFAGYPAKQDLKQLLPYIIDDRSTDLLVSSAGNALASFRQALKIADGIREDADLLSWVAKNLTRQALDVLIFDTTSEAGGFNEALLERITESIPVSLSLRFELFIAKALAYQSVNPGFFPGSFMLEASTKARSATHLPVEELLVLLLNKPGKQIEAGKLLSARFADRQFVELRKGDDSGHTAILEYLVPGSKRLMDGLLKEYTDLLAPSLPNTSRNRILMLLRELFWQCVVNYAHHGGRIETLTRSFETAVRYRFRSQTESIACGDYGAVEVGQKRHKLANGERLPANDIFLLIKECFDLGRESVGRNEVIFRLDDLLITAVEKDKQIIGKIVHNITLTGDAIALMDANLSFERFGLLAANDSSTKIHEAISTLRLLYELIDGIAPGAVSHELASKYWKQLWAIIKTGSLPAAELKKLLQESLHEMATKTNADSEFIISEINKRHYRLTPGLRAAFIDFTPAFSLLPEAATTVTSWKIRQLKQRGMLYDLTYHLVTLRQVPLWLGGLNGQKVNELLAEIAVHHPINIMLVLKHNTITDRQMIWLNHNIEFRTLIKSIGELNRTRQQVLSNLAVLYEMFGKAVINGISADQMRTLVFRKLIKAWTTNNWKLISPENIWNELLWTISIEYGIVRAQFVTGIENSGVHMPPALKIPFDHMKGQDKKSATALLKGTVPIQLKKLEKKSSVVVAAKEGIPVKNAGMVLINNYVTMLFERLDVVRNQAFINQAARGSAVHYLQYVVTGLTKTEEHLLPLNKVLCGLPLAHPVPDEIEIPEMQRKMVDGLIAAMISHWPAIGDSSVNGFRGNWLVRNGLLAELDDRWELKVEKRAYDILLQQSPFSFSIIKYPWMDKPIHVNWPY